jgi:hypothetical protein
MKKISVFIIPLLFSFIAFAQPKSNPGMNELKEKVIPWDRILPPIVHNAPAKPGVAKGRNYTAFQLGLINTFADWIKKSYIPIGGVPQEERYAVPYFRENEAYQYLPQGTGINMGMWGPCYDASGKKIIKAQPASASYISIFTNTLNGLEVAYDFNTTAKFYFTMYYNTRGKLVKDEGEKKNAPYVNEIQSKIGSYFVYFTGRTVNVLLMQGNELPIVQVSKGEVLDQSEEAIKRRYPDPNSSMQKEVLADIKKFRNKHRNNLQEPAYVYMTQLTCTSFRGEKDPFEPLINDPKQMYPVYRFKPEMYELTKQDKPQWVHISFPYSTEKSTTKDWEIFKAMTTNFNYQYVYDYFFNPDKVKGKTYQPLKAVTLSDAVVKIDTRENKANQTKTFPEGVHFMENFSDAQSGAMPAGWSSRQNNRGFVIETPAGENGKWLCMDSGSDLLASSLKKPLPADFTLEFDLFCTDYTNRTGRTVTMNLTGPNTSVNLSITPGNEQNIKIYPSMANFRVGSPATNGIGYHSIEFASYSNKKTKAHIKIIKSGTSIVAYINGVKVESDPKYKQDYNKEMALGSNTVLNKLEWTSDTVSKNPPEDKGKVYISNVKITKN